MVEPAPKPRISASDNEIAGDGVPAAPYLTQTLEQLREIMCASGAVVAVCDPEGLHCLASIGDAPAVGSRLHSDSAFTRECLNTGAVMLCEDAENDSRIQPSIAKSLGLGSAVAVPIQGRSSIVGIIEVFCPQPFGISQNDVTSLKEIAEMLANILAPESGPDAADPVAGSAPLRAADQTPLPVEQIVDEPQPLAEQAFPPLAAKEIANMLAAISGDKVGQGAPDPTVGSSPLPDEDHASSSPEKQPETQRSVSANWFGAELGLPAEQAAEAPQRPAKRAFASLFAAEQAVPAEHTVDEPQPLAKRAFAAVAKTFQRLAGN